MATVDSNAFELERRGFQWSMNNTLDDGETSLLYDSNPNSVVDGNTDGETKLHSLLPGATYFQSTGEWWVKTGSPNTWGLINIGGSGDTIVYELSAKTTSQVDALSAAIDNIPTFSLPNGSNNIINFFAADLSNNSNNLSTTEIACFDIDQDIRGAKLVISVHGSANYKLTEILICYYDTGGSTGVEHVEYGTIGDSSIVDFGTRLSGTSAVLQLTPAITGLHVDIQHTVVLSTTASPS